MVRNDTRLLVQLARRMLYSFAFRPCTVSLGQQRQMNETYPGRSANYIHGESSKIHVTRGKTCGKKNTGPIYGSNFKTLQKMQATPRAPGHGTRALTTQTRWVILTGTSRREGGNKRTPHQHTFAPLRVLSPSVPSAHSRLFICVCPRAKQVGYDAGLPSSSRNTRGHHPGTGNLTIFRVPVFAFDSCVHDDGCFFFFFQLRVVNIGWLEGARKTQGAYKVYSRRVFHMCFWLLYARAIRSSRMLDGAR